MIVVAFCVESFIQCAPVERIDGQQFRTQWKLMATECCACAVRRIMFANLMSHAEVGFIYYLSINGARSACGIRPIASPNPVWKFSI